MKLAYIDCNALAVDELQQQFTPLLSKQQLARAAAFRYAELRELYIVRQGILYTLLAHELKIQPNKIKLQYTEHHKPFIESHTRLHFSVSHSHNHLLYALCEHGPCGVDIEAVNTDTVTALISSEALSEQEQKTIQTLPPAQQTIAFYSSWVQKEAYLKAIGTGLQQSPQAIDLPVHSNLPSELPELSTPTLFQNFYLYRTQPKANLIACVATTNSDVDTVQLVEFC